ncbi:ligase-associated DNA damage response endonuclease PdeM [Mucilaginibacter myungsuensis]|uniref:Ligase-associated DNA damage response endonuclease PdeM n=1 Tax=Mucilaginibacter myungsuensis TaxID=649104 RepID=A0A929KWN6_9SPHI|nr:ligase-associated DNA damage response endonuclease PdeM [Mucilaginibacter myungsuensis]MBE9662057.1 ligase-associated DNA damage response endonuclease PdeM [Mucilaginibacter myungsuensis]MDN3599510.1 ligase-associated DNA damage response endonuclease PdeM [Mucilaginibacter myungsuensis]
MTKANGGMEHILLDQHLLLLPQKAIYWQQEQALIVADVHLGKVGHFRKAGIAVPRDMEQDDLACLSDLIHEHRPRKIIFLGDLFHSDMNNDWDWFAMWRRNFPKLQMILIKGNHDIIHDRHYLELDVELHQRLLVGPFLMLHHPQSDEKLLTVEGYVFCGHIHPGVLLSGRARQRVTLPCFAFGDRQVVLPSFGKFTGKVAMRHQEQDKIFGVLKDKVICLS